MPDESRRVWYCFIFVRERDVNERDEFNLSLTNAEPCSIPRLRKPT